MYSPAAGSPGKSPGKSPAKTPESRHLRSSARVTSAAPAAKSPGKFPAEKPEACLGSAEYYQQVRIWYGSHEATREKVKDLMTVLELDASATPWDDTASAKLDSDLRNAFFGWQYQNSEAIIVVRGAQRTDGKVGVAGLKTPTGIKTFRGIFNSRRIEELGDMNVVKSERQGIPHVRILYICVVKREPVEVARR